MVETMQEVCASIDWIMHDSDTGFFLIVASEDQQRGLRLKYKDALVYIYDWESNTEDFKLSQIIDLVEGKIETQTIFFFNIQNAIKSKSGVHNINFLRDEIARTRKNIIFVTNPEGYDRLNREALDLFSFMELILFLCELNPL